MEAKIVRFSSLFLAWVPFGPQGVTKVQKVTLLKAPGGPRPHFLVDFCGMIVNFFLHILQLSGIKIVGGFLHILQLSSIKPQASSAAAGTRRRRRRSAALCLHSR